MEAVLLLVFLTVPPLPGLLGGTLPDALGWVLALLAVPAVLLADTAHKATHAALVAARRRRSGDLTPDRRPHPVR